MNMAYRELWTHKGMDRKALEPELKVYGLYNDSKTSCSATVWCPHIKYKTVWPNLINGRYWRFGCNWTYENSSYCCIWGPLHTNTWKLSVDSIALNTGGQDLCCLSMLTLSQRLMTVDRVCGHGTGQGRSTTLALNDKLWYSRQIYMLLGINNREYSKNIQVYKQLSH